METEMDSKLICQISREDFSCTSSRNRHIRDFHSEVEQPTRKKRIMCPLCPNEQVNLEVFTVWKGMEKREVDYACDVKRKNSNGEDILYNCNRSDSRGYVSSSKKRSMKTGGSIRIHGMCPSRIKAEISKDGTN